MNRSIIVPAQISASALGELKAWLAITGTGEDATLTALLRAALELCEAFTGTVPLEVEAEELITPNRDWQRLTSRPVNALVSAESIAADGTRAALASTDYEIDLDAEGCGSVRVIGMVDTTRIAVRFTAGLAPDWDSLPQSLRQGLVRFAAAQYRSRDDARSGGATAPPAAVSALWQPWRRMRLA